MNKVAIIINFQEYVRTKKKKNDEVKTSNILTENGKIIYFNREDLRI